MLTTVMMIAMSTVAGDGCYSCASSGAAVVSSGCSADSYGYSCGGGCHKVKRKHGCGLFKRKNKRACSGGGCSSYDGCSGGWNGSGCSGGWDGSGSGCSGGWDGSGCAHGSGAGCASAAVYSGSSSVVVSRTVVPANVVRRPATTYASRPVVVYVTAAR